MEGIRNWGTFSIKKWYIKEQGVGPQRGAFPRIKFCWVPPPHTRVSVRLSVSNNIVLDSSVDCSLRGPCRLFSFDPVFIWDRCITRVRCLIKEIQHLFQGAAQDIEAEARDMIAERKTRTQAGYYRFFSWEAENEVAWQVIEFTFSGNLLLRPLPRETATRSNLNMQAGCFPRKRQLNVLFW